MRTLMSILFAFHCLSSSVTNADENCSSESDLVLVENMKNIEALPKRFRTPKDALKTSSKDINLNGFLELNASASGQFSEKSLSAIQNKLQSPKNLYIVDLRQESHGFINGTAVSWYAFKDWGNINKSLDAILAEECRFLNLAFKQRNITIYQILTKTGTGAIATKKPIDFAVNEIHTEAELVASQCFKYFRIPVTDHLKPTTEDVDRFIQFVRNLPQNSWIHFHCSAGQGRSTSFLTMYDIMINAKTVSLEDIFLRQAAIGGLDFNKPPKHSSWKYTSAVERVDFLKDFYTYCLGNKDNYNQLWSGYLLNK